MSKLRGPSFVCVSPFTRRFWKAVEDCLYPLAKSIEMPERHSIRDLAEACLAEIPQPSVLVGHCLGALIVLEMLKLDPDKVIGLVLVNPAAPFDSPIAHVRRRTRIAKLEALSGTDTLPDETYLEHAAAWMTADAIAKRPGGIARIKAVLADVPVERSLMHQKALIDRGGDYLDLTSFNRPILVVEGLQDRVCPAGGGWIRPGMGKAFYRQIDQCGHLAPLEQPQALSALILDWWQCLELDHPEAVLSGV